MLHLSINKQLNHFNLEVNFKINNEIVVLFGPSGSGKTTILNMISGITDPDSGFIKLGEHTLYEKKHSVPVQKRNVGYLFQDYALFPHMNVEKNILYGAKKKGLEINSPLVSKLIDVMGIKHLLGKYPNNISGGEKQRVALARALVTQPKILLLDEPFSALDEETKIECHEELLRLHDIWKIPVILVTHNLDEAKKLGDKILFIEKGKFKHAIEINTETKKQFKPSLLPSFS